MQQNTELLIVTVAQMQSEKETLALARVRMIIETLRSAVGLTTAHFYRGQNNIYVMLTTWEDKESWQKAQERHNPQQLLLDNREVLAQPPRQWILTYTWGYRRPTAPPTLASAHLVILPEQELQQVQQRWQHELHQPELQASLTFGFLAQGSTDPSAAAPNQQANTVLNKHEPSKQTEPGSLLLAFYSWSNEIERNEFMLNTHYQQLKVLEEQASSVLVLSLETL
jgi:hypothetical protein